MGNFFRKAWSEFRRIVAHICNHPSHLQRLSIVFAGVSVYPMLVAMIAILVWFGIHPVANAALVIPIFGNIAYGLIGLFGLVSLALLGIVRSVKAILPNGTSFGIDLVDSKDSQNDPES